MVKNKEEKGVTKKQLFDDFKNVLKSYEEEYPNSKKQVSRDYYRLHSEFKTDSIASKIFGTFDNFKKEFLNTEGGKYTNFEKDKKIKILQDENNSLKKEKDDLLAKSIAEDIILDLYREKIVNITIPKKLEIKAIKNDNKDEAILALSDFHASEIINSDHIHGINDFNFDIMTKRLDRIFYYFIYYCKKFGIKKVHLLFLGDLFSGTHHEELMRTNEFDEVTALFKLQEYIGLKLLEIENNFSEINCEFVVGNHSRIPQGKPQWKLSGILNYEYILAKQLEIQFNLLQKTTKAKKIKINTSPCLFKIVEIAKRRFFITHGHMLSNGSNSFAGIPYYGLAMSGAKIHGYLTSQDNVVRDSFSDVLMGHLHCSSRVKLPAGNLYINGSIIGTGEFSLFKMKSISEPEQLMLVVRDGKVTNELTLRGDE